MEMFQRMLSDLGVVAVVITIILFMLSFLISTFIVRRGIPLLVDDEPEMKTEEKNEPVIIGVMLPESSSKNVFDLRSTGFWIGFCETFLIFILVFAEAFSALAIIIGAKQFVRREKINLRPSYYLLGTLVNLMIAVFFALIAKQMFPWLSLAG